MRRALAVLALSIPLMAHALEVAPPPYRPREAVEGVVRLWSSAAMGPLLERWEAGFRARHPKVTFEQRLAGSEVAMAGLYTGVADIAVIGREATANEVKAFEWVYRYRPLPVEVASGSLDTPGRSPALVAYVHRDNPLARLTLAQLDAIFSRERLRGAPRALATWGDLGLAGEWAARPIRLYTFDTESGTGRFFRDTVLKDSRMLEWDRLTEFRDTAALRAPTHDAGRLILEALARDRHGLAVASGPAVGGVKALALGETKDAAITATRESVVSRRYPLARSVLAYVNRKPATRLDAPVAEFLRYVLSEEGQAAVEPAGFLPLERFAAGREAGKLR